MTDPHTPPSPASGGGLTMEASRDEWWRALSRRGDPARMSDAGSFAAFAAGWAALAATRTDAAAGWADISPKAQEALQLAARTAMAGVSYTGSEAHELLCELDAIARRRMAALPSADSFTARNAAEHAALVREAGGEGLREAARQAYEYLRGQPGAFVLDIVELLDAALTSPRPAKEPDPVPNYAPRIEAPSAFMRGDFEPAKEPGAAGAGLTWAQLGFTHREVAEAAVSALPGETALEAGLHGAFAMGAKWAAQRHPAPGSGGEAGDAALRGMLLECKRVIENGPVDDVLWAEGICPETLCDKIERVLGSADDETLSPPDAPPRAEPDTFCGIPVMVDPALPDGTFRLEPASPPAPVAQAEEALGAEELASIVCHADAMENTDTPAGRRVGPLLHRLIAAARASRVAGAEGELRDRQLSFGVQGFGYSEDLIGALRWSVGHLDAWTSGRPEVKNGYVNVSVSVPVALAESK